MNRTEKFIAFLLATLELAPAEAYADPKAIKVVHKAFASVYSDFPGQFETVGADTLHRLRHLHAVDYNPATDRVGVTRAGRALLAKLQNVTHA